MEYSWQSSYSVPSLFATVRGLTLGQRLHDYGYLNLRLNYKPAFSVLNAKDPIVLSVYLKNLLNNRPEETLLGTTNIAPGREVFFGAEVQF